MYAIGLTTRQISEQINEIYGFEASASLIFYITDKYFLKSKSGKIDH